MKTLLALDISTSCGWALFIDRELEESGLIVCKDKNISYKEFSHKSTEAMFGAVNKLSKEIIALIGYFRVDTVVIEQTNKGQSRWSQKLLEWMHYRIITDIYQKMNKYPEYLDSSEWRKIVGLQMSKEDLKHNQRIRKEHKRGKIGKKHLAVRLVNEIYNLNFRMKDNDRADAILLGTAFIKKSIS